jgi:hypothetical protein
LITLKQGVSNIRAVGESGVAVLSLVTGDTLDALRTAEGISPIDTTHPLPVQGSIAVTGTSTVDVVSSVPIAITGTPTVALTEASRSSSVGGGNGVYSNAQEDFVAVVSGGSKTVSLTSVPISVTAINVAEARQYSTGGTATIIPLTNIIVSGASPSYNLTFADMSVNFDASDTVRVMLFGPDKTYDSSQDVAKTLVQNPQWGRYQDPTTYIDAVSADTTGSTIDVRGYNTLFARYAGSNTAGLHGALLLEVSYDGGTTFVAGAVAIPITKNCSGLVRIDVTAFTHVRLNYDEIAATVGTCSVSVGLSVGTLTALQVARPPVTAYLRESAILTSGDTNSFLIDCLGYDYADIYLNASTTADSSRVQATPAIAPYRGGSLAGFMSTTVPAAALGDHISITGQASFWLWQPVGTAPQVQQLMIPLVIRGAAQLQVAFKDPSGAGTLTTLESYVVLHN